MLKEFVQFIESNGLAHKNERILTAVSGGVDSIVLAHLLHEAGFQIALAHCNFQLRGADSDLDEQLVEKLGTTLEVQVFSKRFEVLNKTQNEGISIQMAARDIRYQWFSELLIEEGFDRVATAHHQNDHVETILLNLIRGTGLSGLTGIPMKRDVFIRPLLSTSKKEILAYAKKEGLEWREDHSNRENKYKRNLVRNELIPWLEKVNPSIVETLSRTSSHLSQVEVLLKDELLKLQSTVIETSGNDVVVNLEQISPKSRTTVFISYYLMEYGFNQFQIDQIIQSLGETGVRFVSPSHELNIDRGRLLIFPINDEIEYFEIRTTDKDVETKFLMLSISSYENGVGVFKRDRLYGVLDSDLLSHPLILRTWQPGDRFTPLGMKGKKKVSDFMIDRKIPLNLKKRQLVLSSGEEIVWVVGQEISDKFKVTDKTKRILEIKIAPNYD